jgi:hypothetical protein
MVFNEDYGDGNLAIHQQKLNNIIRVQQLLKKKAV